MFKKLLCTIGILFCVLSGLFAQNYDDNFAKPIVTENGKYRYYELPPIKTSEGELIFWIEILVQQATMWAAPTLGATFINGEEQPTDTRNVLPTPHFRFPKPTIPITRSSLSMKRKPTIGCKTAMMTFGREKTD